MKIVAILVTVANSTKSNFDCLLASWLIIMKHCLNGVLGNVYFYVLKLFLKRYKIFLFLF